MALTKNSLIKDGAITTDTLAENVRVSFANTSQFAEISSRLDSAFAKANTANDAVVSAVAGAVPKISNVSIANSTYAVLDDTAIATDGGYLVITGTGFTSGSQVLIDRTPALSTTYVNSTTLRAQVDSANAETYNVYVVNPDGGTATRVNGLTYSGTPTWVTGTTLDNGQVDVAFTPINFSASGASSYSNTTALPAGTTLLSNGYFYGTVTGIESDTTYNFTIRATDAENQDSDRTFTKTVYVITAPPSVQYLVVAGGGGTSGGPGAYAYGGGGAGGLLSGTMSITAGQSYTATVGAGGTRGGSRSTRGSPGQSSSFYNITTVGGGAAGYSDSPNATQQSGLSGGSGGGGNEYGGTTGSGGAGTAGPPRQGYNGGAAWGSGTGAGAGGGGGAGGVGQSGDANFPSVMMKGGVGVEWPTGSGTYYAGGGGGGSYGERTPQYGTGGLGGGGNGGTLNSNPGTNGTVNTGGGAGGGGYNNNLPGAPGGNIGGSGVVIIRYDSIYSDAYATTGSPTYTNTGGYKTYKFTGSGSITW